MHTSVSVSRSVGSSACVTARSSRKPLHAPPSKAFLNDIGAGFAQIFSPLRRGNKEDWTGTETPFNAKISHHSDARKPFKDGWQVEAASRGDSEPAAAPEAAEGNVLNFINKAAENVVAHNFTGDAEPAAWKNTASTGWGADIHSRSRDGFHSITPVPQPASSKKPAAAAAAPATEEKEAGAQDSAMTFLAEAAENVIAHNFTGDGTEPEAWKGQGDKTSSGWKGDIHTRARDGFHSI